MIARAKRVPNGSGAEQQLDYGVTVAFALALELAAGPLVQVTGVPPRRSSPPDMLLAP
jgi:hypothetical protein